MDVSSDSVDAQITRAIEQEWSFLRQKLTKLKTKWLRCGQQVLELKKLISNQYQLLESFSSSVTAAEKSQRVNLLTDKIEQFTSIKNAAELLYEKKSLDVFHLEVVLYTEPRISLLPTDQNEQEAQKDLHMYLKRRFNNYQAIDLNGSDSIRLLARQLGINILDDGEIEEIVEQSLLASYETDRTESLETEFNLDQLDSELSSSLEDQNSMDNQ